MRDRRAEDEASRLGAEDEVGFFSLPHSASFVDRVLERHRVGQERRDVLEADARLRPVRDLPDLLGEIHPIMLTQPPERAPEELAQLLRELRERLEILETGTAALGIAARKAGADELLDQPGLAVGGRPEAAQVPRRNAERASWPQASAISASTRG